MCQCQWQWHGQQYREQQCSGWRAAGQASAAQNLASISRSGWCGCIARVHFPRAHSVLRGCVEILYSWGSIGCALALKFCGGAKTHLNSKTWKVFCEILIGVQVIQIINYFNGFPKSKLRKIK